MNTHSSHDAFARPVRHQAPHLAHEPVRVITSSALLDGRTEIAIDHGGAIYRLKLTRQGKLILNK